MKIEVWPQYGPQNSKPIFNAFIKSLQDAGEQIYVNRPSDNADVAVIWSVLWRGRMQQYHKIWNDYRSKGKPVVVLEVGGLRRNKSFKVGINGINRDADLTLVDLNQGSVIKSENMKSRCGWTPFDGKEVNNTIKGTLVAGKWAYHHKYGESKVGSPIVFG